MSISTMDVSQARGVLWDFSHLDKSSRLYSIECPITMSIYTAVSTALTIPDARDLMLEMIKFPSSSPLP